MFGNFMTGPLVRTAMAAQDPLAIVDFSEDRFRNGLYTLTNAEVHSNLGPGLRPHKWQLSDGTYELAPDEYVMVVAKERVVLPFGIRGAFVTASSAIQTGLLVTHGKLDSEYKGRPVIFGLKNLLPMPVHIDQALELIHLQFIDQRGLPHDLPKVDDRRAALFAVRESSLPTLHSSVVGRLESVRNEYETLRNYGKNTRSAGEVADVLARIIQDLKKSDDKTQ